MANWYPNFLLRLASPPVFFQVAGRLVPWFFTLAGVLAVAGLVTGYVIAPTDMQQGDAYRIIYLHVPAAWMSMFLYLVGAAYAAVALVFRTQVAAVMMRATWQTGAWFTVAALVTGSLWGRPTWGAYWVWDARLTSELVLLFLYLGVMALAGAIEDEDKSDRAAATLALLGVVNVPIIYFSVRWWNTLHQGSSINFTKAPSMAAIMLTGMLLMALAAWCYAIATVLSRARWMLVERRASSKWARAAVQGLEK